MSIQIDADFRNLLRPLYGDEFSRLEKDILRDGGIKDPLVVWNGILIDGYYRFCIAQKHHLTFKTTEMSFEDRAAAVKWIVDNHLDRWTGSRQQCYYASLYPLTITYSWGYKFVENDFHVYSTKESVQVICIGELAKAVVGNSGELAFTNDSASLFKKSIPDDVGCYTVTNHALKCSRIYIPASDVLPILNSFIKLMETYPKKLSNSQVARLKKAQEFKRWFEENVLGEKIIYSEVIKYLFGDKVKEEETPVKEIEQFLPEVMKMAKQLKKHARLNGQSIPVAIRMVAENEGIDAPIITEFANFLEQEINGVGKSVTA